MNQSENNINGNINDRLDRNNNTNAEVFKTSKLYDKTVKNHKDRNVTLNYDILFLTKYNNTTIPTQSINTFNIGNTKNEK